MSIHYGRHLDSVMTELGEYMTKAYRKGIQKGYSQKQFRNALNRIINAERELLETGKRKLNKNTRPWGK